MNKIEIFMFDFLAFNWDQQNQRVGFVFERKSDVVWSSAFFLSSAPIPLNMPAPAPPVRLVLF